MGLFHAESGLYCVDTGLGLFQAESGLGLYRVDACRLLALAC